MILHSIIILAIIVLIILNWQIILIKLLIKNKNVYNQKYRYMIMAWKHRFVLCNMCTIAYPSYPNVTINLL